MKKTHEDDDGRVIADMSGIPAAGGGLREAFKGRVREVETMSDGQLEGSKHATDAPEMSKEDRLVYLFGAIGAALAIGLVFLVAAGILILFLTTVW